MNKPPSHDERNHRNVTAFVSGQALQGLGDRFVAAKTVLPWLFQSAGAPAWMTALLTPVRESGSMLPQSLLSPWVRTKPRRTRVWVLGAIGQALSAALMVPVVFLTDGALLGALILLLLATLATSRALTSIASKDVQGRIVDKGERGGVLGWATALGGAFALLVGIGLIFIPGTVPLWVIATLIAVGAGSWALAALVFSRIDEDTGSDDSTSGTAPTRPNTRNWWSELTSLLRNDHTFRMFVAVRSLMLVSSLSTTFLVMIAHGIGSAWASLGVFVAVSALAELVAGPISGALSDRSSKTMMAAGASIASLAALTAASLSWWASSGVLALALPVLYFIVQLAHTSIRVARRTYLVDAAEGDTRTLYTAHSNTLMGIVLLLAGGISGALATLGPELALVFLAATGLAGVIASRSLPEVSTDT